MNKKVINRNLKRKMVNRTQNDSLKRVEFHLRYLNGRDFQVILWSSPGSKSGLNSFQYAKTKPGNREMTKEDNINFVHFRNCFTKKTD